MHRRFIYPVAVLGVLLTLPLFAQAADKPADKSTKPGVILRFASLDHLRGDFRYLAEVVGQAEPAKQLDELIQSKLGEKGFEGIDTKKPLGAYGWIGAFGIDSRIVILIPISNEKGFLDLISEQLDVKPDKGGDGVYTLNVEKVLAPIYLRFADKYAYLTMRDKELLDNDKRLAPEAVLKSDRPETLSLYADVDQIPRQLKELALGTIENRLADFKENEMPGHTAAQKKFRDGAIDELGAFIKSVLKNGGDATLRLHLDRKNGDLSLTASVAGKSGTPLAEDIDKLGQMRSVTAALLRPDSALKGELNVNLPEKLRKLLQPALKDAEKSALARAGENQRELVNTILDGIRPTLQAAELDTAIDLQGPSDKGLYTLLGGVKIKDGRNLEKSFRKSAAQFGKLVNLDVEKAGDVNIHRINAGKNLKESARRTFGDNPTYLAFRDDVLLLGAGEKGLSALKEVLSIAPTTGKVVDLQVAVSRLVPLADNEKVADIAHKVFGDDKQSDRLHFTVEGGKKLTLRLSLKAKLIEYVRQVSNAKKE